MAGGLLIRTYTTYSAYEDPIGPNTLDNFHIIESNGKVSFCENQLRAEIKRLEDLILSLYSYLNMPNLSNVGTAGKLLSDEALAIRERRKNG